MSIAARTAPGALLLAALALAAPAHGQDSQTARLVSNAKQVTAGEQTLGTEKDAAQSFTTGRFPTAGATLTHIDMGFEDVTASSSTVFPTVTLHRGSATSTPVATMTTPTQTSGTIGDRPYAAPANTTLRPSTTYWVVAEGGNVKWSYTNSNGEEQTDGDWSIGDVGATREDDATGAFADRSDGAAFQIQVRGRVGTPAPPTGQSALVHNLDQSATFNSSIIAVSSTKRAAQVFRTAGADSDSYTLQSVEAAFGSSFSSADLSALSATICTLDSSGHPDSCDITLTKPDAIAGAFVFVGGSRIYTTPTVFTAPANTTLSGGTDYALVLSTSGSGSHSPVATREDAESGVTDFTIGDAALIGTVSGMSTTWAAQSGGYSLLVRVNGITASSDTTAPRVTSIVRHTPSTTPTNADSLTWRVTFDENVKNVDAADFSVAGTTAVLAVSEATASTVYDVTASGGNLAGRDGTVTLFIDGDHDIKDLADNELTNVTPTGAVERVWVVDNTAPGFASAAADGTRLLLTLNETPAAAASLANSAFTVEKTPDGGSEQTVSLGSTAPAIDGATVTLTLATALSPTDTDVKVSYTKPGSGSDNKLADAAGNETASFADEPVTNDTPAAPGAPRDLAAAPGNARVWLSWTAPASDGGAAIARYQYRHKAGMGSFGNWTDVPDGSDAGTETGDETGVAVTSLSNGTTYTFEVRAVNRAGNGAAASATGAPGATDATAPRVASITRGTPASSPTNADALTWRVVFSEAVSNVNAADFAVSGSSATVASVTAVTGATGAYDVRVSGGNLANLDATVTLGFAAGQNIADPAGNALADTVPTGTNRNTYAVDNTAPTVRSASVLGRTLTIAFSEALDPAHPPDFGDSLVVQASGSGSFPAAGCFSLINPFASLSIGGAAITVTLTFDSCAVNRYTIEYNKGATPPRDLAGNVGADEWRVDATNNNPVIPEAPINIVYTAGDGQISASWEEGDDGNSPILKYQYCNKPLASAGDCSTWTDVPDSNSDGDLADERSVTVTGLANGTEYSFNLRAVNAVGPGRASGNNVTPTDTNAPSFSSAAANGTSLVITLSETLAAAANLANSAFTVRKTPAGGSEQTVSLGSTAPAIHEATVTLTLATALSPTDTGVKVSYTKPDSGTDNKLKDAAGNETASFANEPVTNDTAAEPGAPGGLTATPGNAQVSLSWTAPDSDGGSAITKYQYRYKADSGSFGNWTDVPDGSDAGTETGDETGVTVTSLTNGTAYTFEVRAVNGEGNGAAATATATPTLLPVLSIADASATEGSPVAFTVTLSRASASAVTATWTATVATTALESNAVAGDLGSTTTGTVSITAGSTSATVSVATVQDSVHELDETFTVTLSSPSGATVSASAGSATGTIDNDEALPTVTWSISRTSLRETDDTDTADVKENEAVITANLSHAASGNVRMRISFSEDDNTVVTHLRRRISHVDVSPGSTSGTATLVAQDNETDSPDRTDVLTVRGAFTQLRYDELEIDLDLTNPTNTFSLSILDDDPAPEVNLQISPATLTENVRTAPVVTLSLDRPSSEATAITLSVPAGTLEILDPTVTIPAGRTTPTSGTLLPALLPINNQTDSPNREVKVTVAAVNTQGISEGDGATLTINDDDPAPVATLTLSPAAVGENGGVSTVTVGLDRPSSEATTVTVSAAAVSPAVAGDFTLSTNRTLTVAAGSQTSTGTVTVTGVNNSAVAPDKQVTVSAAATNSQGVRASSTATPGTSDVALASRTLTLSNDDTEAPGAPGLTAIPGDAQVMLSWTAPASDGGAAIAKYQYRYKASSGSFGNWTDVPDGSDSGTETGDETGVTVTSLTNGTAYTFEVRAVNSAGDGAAATATATPSETDTTAPVFLSAAADGTSLVITMSETLAAAASLANSAFTVKKTPSGGSEQDVTLGSTAPAIDAATVTLTLATALLPTDTGVKVSYAKPATGTNNKLADAAANETASFSNRAVTNNTAAVPGAPGSLAATPGNAQVSLSWTAAAANNSAITKYQYRRKADSGSFGNWTDVPDGSDAGTETGDETGVTVTSLTNGTAYTFEVRAVNGEGNGAAATATATPVAPDTTAPRVTSVARRTPLTSPTNADGLTWRVTFSENVKNVNAADFAVAGTTATLTVTEVTASTVYNVAASGGNLANLDATVTLSFASGQDIKDLADNALANTTPTGTNDNTYAVDNTAPAFASAAANGATLVVTLNETLAAASSLANGAFRVKKTPSGGAEQTVSLSSTAPAINGATVTLTLATALLPTDTGVKVSYTRPTTGSNNRLADAAGNETASFTDQSVTNNTTATPGAPGNFTAVRGNGQVVLSWTAPSNSVISKYQYRYAAGASVPAATAWTDVPDSNSNGDRTDETAHTVTGLTNGTAYAFEVRAVNSDGGGTAAAATATPATVPGAPGNLTATPGDGQVVLDWAAPANNGGDAVTRYEWRSAPGNSVPQTTSWTMLGNVTGHTVTGLANGTQYAFEVRAVNGPGHGPAATARATPEAPASAPGGGSEGGGSDGQGQGSGHANPYAHLPALGFRYRGETQTGRYPYFSVPENAGRVAVTVVLEAPQETPVRVPWYTVDFGNDGDATAGEDYQAAEGLLVFAPGQTEKTISLRIIDDTVVDGRGDNPPLEEFQLKLDHEDSRDRHWDAPHGGWLTLYIRDNDGARAQLPTLSVFTRGAAAEGRALTVGARRSGGTDEWATAFVELLDTETGAELDNFGIEIPAGAREATESWTVPYDGKAGNRQVTVKLLTWMPYEDYRSAGPSAEHVTVRVQSGEANVRVSDASVSEGPNATLSFRVRLDRALNEDVTVDYATADGTATAGSDYQTARGTLRIDAGDREGTIGVTVLDDAVDDNGETLTLTLSNPRGPALLADAEAVGTIRNADPLPAAWLSRFGRVSADHTLDAIAARLQPRDGAQPESHLTVGGRRVDTLIARLRPGPADSSLADGRTAGPADSRPPGRADGRLADGDPAEGDPAEGDSADREFGVGTRADAEPESGHAAFPAPSEGAKPDAAARPEFDPRLAEETRWDRMDRLRRELASAPGFGVGAPRPGVASPGSGFQPGALAPTGLTAAGLPSASLPSARLPSSDIPSARSTSLPSAGLPSASPPSAGPPSAGPPSAGPPSAGPPSAGPPSAGPPSAGPAGQLSIRRDAEGDPDWVSVLDTVAQAAGEARWARLYRRGQSLAGQASRFDLRDLMLGSSFLYSRGGDGAEGAGTGPFGSWSAWGTASATRFGGADGLLSLEGDVATATLGIDAEPGERWMAGLALSYSDGEGSYAHPAAGAGALRSSLTSLTPYARYAFNDRTMLWGAFGRGTGKLSLTPGAADSGTADTGTEVQTLSTDLENTLAAFGGRTELSSRRMRAGTMDLAVVSDARFARTSSGAAGGLSAAAGETSRVRMMLEGRGEFALPGGVRLEPTLQAGLRRDGGDAETGAGLEIAAGVGLHAGALSLQLDARGLAAHEDAAYEERGFAAALTYSPGREGRGLSLKLGSAWGAGTASGVQSLWSGAESPGIASHAAGAAGGRRLETEIAYGFMGRKGRALWTPFLAADAASGAAALRFGTRLHAGPHARAELLVTRAGAAARPGAPGDLQIALGGSILW